jgi:antitoxin (DNA-binding transcriptional repressor) of toxin-antitoxin stability system
VKHKDLVPVTSTGNNAWLFGISTSEFREEKRFDNNENDR